LKNEEGRREEGDKGHARMIPGEGGRGAGMRGGAVSCPTARRCLGRALGIAHSPDLCKPKLNPQFLNFILVDRELNLTQPI
jgi:hypothetical protein